MKFHFTTPVWGKDYIDLFCRVCVPSMLSSGNIPEVTDEFQVIYYIYVLENEMELLAANQAIKDLSGYVEIVYVLIDKNGLLNQNTYAQMNNCHKHFIDYSKSLDVCSVFITPDQIFSMGSISYIVKKMQEGVVLILVAGFRVNKDKLLPDLDKYRVDGTIGIDDLDLNALALKDIHSGAKALFYDNEEISEWPVHLYLKLGNKFILHGFHLHPMALMAGAVKEESGLTIDFDYVNSFYEMKDRIEIIQSSENFCTYEISSETKEEVADNVVVGDKCMYVAYWASQYAMDIHRYFFAEPITYRVGENIGEVEGAEDVLNRVQYWLDVYEGRRIFNYEKTTLPRLKELYEKIKKYEEVVQSKIEFLDSYYQEMNVLAVWGGGSTGAHFSSLLSTNGIQTKYYIDSNKEGCVGGKRVVQWSSGLTLGDVDGVVVTCGMSEYLAEMRAVRENVGLENVILLTRMQAWRGHIRDEYLILLIMSKYLMGRNRELYMAELIEEMIKIPGLRGDIVAGGN